MSDEPHEYEKLPDLMGDIYDTTLDSERWNNVLASIIDFVGGRACELVSKDPVSGLGNIKYQAGIDPHYMQLYAETYAKFGPVTNLSPIGRVVSIPDLVPYDDYRRGPFCQEWLRPQDLADTAIVVLEKSAADATFLVVVPGKANSMVDDEMRRRLALIAPHARRALLVGRAMEQKRAKQRPLLNARWFSADFLSMLVAGLSTPMPLARTCSMRAVLSTRLGAVSPLGIRRPTRPCTRCSPPPPQAMRRGQGHRLAADRARRRALCRSCAAAHIGGAAQRGPRLYRCRRCLCAQSGTGNPPEVIAQTYKLTPAEQRVLLAIVEVGGVPETAEALGIAETTVKTHLYRLFDKAGVGRQADLVKLVASFANPLSGEPYARIREAC